MKLKRLFSGLLVSLIAIVSVLLCVKVSNAEEKFIKFEFATADSDSSTDISSNLDGLKKLITSNNADLISSVSGTKVYAGKNGLKFGSGSVKGNMTFTLSEKYNVTKFVLNVAAYSSDNGKKMSLSHDGSNFEDVTLSTTLTDYKFEETNPTELDTFTVSAVIKSNNRFYVKSISIYYSDAQTTTYKVSFDANGFNFKEGKGKTITTDKGEETTVTLPVIEDIANAVKGYSLIGWSDGTNTKKPGEKVTVNAKTMFTAKYEEDNSEVLSVKEAIALYDCLGKRTTKDFKVTGVISAFDSTYPNTFTIVDETDNTKELKMYNPATKVADSKVAVGDKIIGNGYITKYKSTYELDKDCTYVKFVPTAEEFKKVETMSSLSFDWATEDGNNYTVTNVSLRFGNLFSANAYDSNATYGVLLIQNSDLNGGDFATYLAGKTLDDIKADRKIKNVVGSPVKVNAEGVADDAGEYYQFAAVLSDMGEYNEEKIIAIMYMVVDGQIYYSVEKKSSVSATAQQYLEDYEAGKIVITDDQENALYVLL